MCTLRKRFIALGKANPIQKPNDYSRVSRVRCRCNRDTFSGVCSVFAQYWRRERSQLLLPPGKRRAVAPPLQRQGRRGTGKHALCQTLASVRHIQRIATVWQHCRESGRESLSLITLNGSLGTAVDIPSRKTAKNGRWRTVPNAVITPSLRRCLAPRHS